MPGLNSSHVLALLVSASLTLTLTAAHSRCRQLSPSAVASAAAPDASQLCSPPPSPSPAPLAAVPLAAHRSHLFPLLQPWSHGRQVSSRLWPALEGGARALVPDVLGITGTQVSDTSLRLLGPC